jgi:TolB-like protein
MLFLTMRGRRNMRTTVAACVIVILGSMLPQCLAQEIGDKGGPTYPLAILNFEERGLGVKDYGAKIGDLVFARLADKTQLQLVDRNDMKKTLEEMELNLSGAVKPSDGLRFGQLTGAKLLVTGSILTVDKKLVIVAKIIGTETTRVFAATVEGRISDDLQPLVERLGDKIVEMIDKNGEKLVAKAASPDDRIAALREKLGKGPRPSVMVRIPERHVGQVVADPAAQTELMKMFRELGFEVLDPDEASKGKADILVTGEGISELAIRRGNLVSVKARVEVKATDRKTGQVLVSDRQTAMVVDLTEQLAGKSALQEASAILATRMLPKIQAVP